MTILSVLCASIAASSVGYVPPQGLWELSSNAELIVIATVEFGAPGTAMPTTFTQAAQWTPTSRERVMQLRVRETLKGATAELIEVLGEHPAGETVLAFLEGAHGRWRFVASRYGQLHPPEDELPVFTDRVREALRLQASSFTKEQKIDWAVRTAAQRATRWHGVWELSAPTESNWFSRNGRESVTQVDENQRRLLADGFIAEPSADDTTAIIAALLKQHTDPRLDLALINAVETLLEGTNSLSAFQVMDEVIKRAGGARRLLYAGINPLAWEHDMTTLRTVWAKARKELRLPK